MSRLCGCALPVAQGSDGRRDPAPARSAILAEGAEASDAAKDASADHIEWHLFAFAMCLASLAGFVDAAGYLKFNGLFVSFMSGNSTRMAVDIGVDGLMTIKLGGAIAAFVVGVIVGELVGSVSTRWGRPLVMSVEVLCLAGAVAAERFGAAEGFAIAFLGLAMGAQNAALHKAGRLNVALTYVTGTLVHVGRGLAASFRGAEPLGTTLPFLGLWLGLVGGGLCGAFAARYSEANALAIAAGYATLLLLWTLILALRSKPPATAASGASSG